jgi:hypothetical protein
MKTLVLTLAILGSTSLAHADGQFFIYNGYGQVRSGNVFLPPNMKYLNIAPQPYSAFNPYYAPVFVPSYAPIYQPYYPMYQPAYMPAWNPGYRW